MKKVSKFAQNRFSGLLAPLVLITTILAPGSQSEAVELHVKVLSADLITLDNNTPENGPNRYQVHARVCNLDPAEAATNVQAKFVFTSIDENQYESTHGSYLHLINPDATSPAYPDEEETQPKSYGTLVDLDAYTGTKGFWDSQDVEDLAGGDPHNIPGYCHDFMFSVYLDLDSYAVNATPRTKRTYLIETWCDEDTTGVDSEDTTYGDGYIHKLNARQASKSSNMTISVAAYDTGTTNPVTTLTLGNTYDFVLTGKLNGQHQAMWGLELDSDIFELVSVTSTFDQKNPTNPKTGLTYVNPFRNNTFFWDFCRWDYDINSSNYGHCEPFVNDNGFYLTGTREGDFTGATQTDGVITTYIVRYIKQESTTISAWVLGESEGSADTTVNYASDITFGPTYANVTAFKAEEIDGKTVVQWTTDAEFGTVGFNVLRKDKRNSAFIQLNQELLPAEPTINGGATYSFVDQTAQVGESYTYKVIEVDVRGVSNNYGPYHVTIGDAATSNGSPKKGFQRKKKTLNKKNKQLNKATRETRKIAKALKQKRSRNNVAKLFIKDDGIYALNKDEISSLIGLSPKKVTKLIKSNRLQIINKDRLIPTLTADNGNSILFYGTGLDSIYSQENVYWLNKGNGLKIESPRNLRRRMPKGDEGATFSRTTVAEENQIYSAHLYQDPNADIWNWTWQRGSKSGTEKTFPLHVADPATEKGQANLKVMLKGSSDTEAPYDHHAVISLNGTQIGESTWSNLDAKTLDLVFDATLLHEGENTITVKALLDDGIPYSWFLVDRFELTYPSLYRAVGDTLEFNSNGNSVVTVHGFSTANITVLDITDKDNPKPVAVRVSNSTDDSFAVTLVPTGSDQRYFAFTGGATMTTTAFPDVRSSLKRARGAKYLIIAPTELLTAAEELADLREAAGMSTMLVDLEDIMDEFNYGIYSPLAIRNFLKLAAKSWHVSPEYVVLIGSASFDYKDYLGIGDNLMPTLAATTPFGLNGSDNIFVDIVGNDGIPEMAIGRIPVRTAEELSAYINKIATYEDIAGGQWSKKGLMMADNQDSAGNFPADSDAIAALLPEDYTIEKVYLPESITGEAHQKVIDSINSGVGTVNYFGHGGFNWLAGEGLLTSNDIDSLSNSPMLPVMNFMTCSAGVIEWAGYRSLAEELVLDEDGGAASVWTASGLSLDHLAKILDEEYYRGAFEQETTTVGQAILKAKTAYGNAGHDIYMLDIYNLIGDPALPLH